MMQYEGFSVGLQSLIGGKSLVCLEDEGLITGVIFSSPEGTYSCASG